MGLRHTHRDESGCHPLRFAEDDSYFHSLGWVEDPCPLRMTDAGQAKIGTSCVYKLRNSRSLRVWALETGISVCLRSCILSWYELLNQGTTSLMWFTFTKYER